MSIYWNKLKFPAQAGKPVAISEAEFIDHCCGGGSRYKCDIQTHVCSQTSEPLGNPDVYATLNACMSACGEPCETEGCDFQVQFYYLQAWSTHQCDSAVFDAYTNNRLLGEVNLNNGSDGGDRFSDLFDVAASDFIALICAYTFELRCKLPFCHQGITGIKFFLDSVPVLDLPSQSGDKWGVHANDICNPAP